MPAKSKKQEKFMQAVAHNKKFAKKVGVPQKVGKEFTKETKVKYKKGGMTISPGDPDSSPELDKKALEKSVEKRLKDVGNQKLKPPSNEGLKKLPTEVRNKMGYMKKGGTVKKGYHRMPDGKIMKDSAHKMSCGGKVHKMKSGGSVKKCACDGIAVRGKTKARR